jgi:DNA modification methylase
MTQEIWHGDCLELMEDIPDKSVDLILTDPPFKMTKNGKSCRPNYMPASSTETFFKSPLLKPEDWMTECFRILKDQTHFYTFCNINDIQEYLNVASKVGFKLHNIIDMIKDTKMPNRWYLKYTERILFFRKGKAKRINDPTSRDYFFVNTPTLKNGKRHPTEKPLTLVEKLISNSSNEGDLVVDLFVGGGTTLVAAKNLNRQFIGIEKEEEYYKICLERLKND